MYKIGDFIVEYLCEIEAEFHKALASESGAQGGLYDIKNRRTKIS
jgi:hypothetical protein